jgi:hypothetical protein
MDGNGEAHGVHLTNCVLTIKNGADVRNLRIMGVQNESGDQPSYTCDGDYQAKVLNYWGGFVHCNPTGGTSSVTWVANFTDVPDETLALPPSSPIGQVLIRETGTPPNEMTLNKITGAGLNTSGPLMLQIVVKEDLGGSTIIIGVTNEADSTGSDFVGSQTKTIADPLGPNDFILLRPERIGGNYWAITDVQITTKA